eukprot:Gb_16639 [translate_table: standard]
MPAIISAAFINGDLCLAVAIGRMRVWDWWNSQINIQMDKSSNKESSVQNPVPDLPVNVPKTKSSSSRSRGRRERAMLRRELALRTGLSTAFMPVNGADNGFSLGGAKELAPNYSNEFMGRRFVDQGSEFGSLSKLLCFQNENWGMQKKMDLEFSSGITSAGTMNKMKGCENLNFQKERDYGMVRAFRYGKYDVFDVGLSSNGGRGNAICRVCCIFDSRRPVPFHFCVRDPVRRGFKGSSPAGPICRPVKRTVEDKVAEYVQVESSADNSIQLEQLEETRKNEGAGEWCQDFDMLVL